MNIQSICAVVLAVAQPLTFTSFAHATDASTTLSTGAVSMVASPLGSVDGNPLGASAFFALGTALVVVGIGAVVGETVAVIVQNTVDGSKAVIHASSSIVKEIGLSTGSAIKVVGESIGYTLVASGQILAFVPNEIGEKLLYQSRLSQ